MEKLNVLLIMIILSLALSGCVESERPSTRRWFVNHTNSYEIVEFSWVGEVEVDVRRGYYFPELSTTCFEINLTDTNDNPEYYLDIKYEDDGEVVQETQDVTVYLNQTQICYSGIDSYVYDLTLYRNDLDKDYELKLLEINLDVTNFDSTKVPDIDIYAEETEEFIGTEDAELNIIAEIETNEYDLSGSIYYVIINDMTRQFVGTASVNVNNLQNDVEELIYPVHDLSRNAYFEITAYYDPYGDQRILLELDQIVQKLSN